MVYRQREDPPQIEPAEAARAAEAGAFLLDVREPEEWTLGHAPGAVHIPLGELGNRLGEVPTDRDLCVICRSGGRSAVATSALLENGARAVNVAGGMLAWQAAGLPIVTDDGFDGIVG